MEHTPLMFVHPVFITFVIWILDVTAQNSSHDQELSKVQSITGWSKPCIPDVNSRHCYQIFDANITWKTASILCRDFGSSLIAIESSEEQTFIQDLMKTRISNATGFWIGSDKLYPEEQRAWTNGHKFSYENWAPGEPDNPMIVEDCVEIYTNDSTWNDVKCTKRNGYICENSRESRNYIPNNHTGRWYKLVDELCTWDIAFNICKQDGGTLLIIESLKEQTFIADKIRDTMLKMKALWLGSTKVHPERKRTWTNGKKFTYVNWAKGEPNNSSYVENCAEMNTSDGMWNNRECTLPSSFICEKTPWNVPCIKYDTSGHCYQLFDTEITWKNASNFCKHEGGNLAIIESVEEQMFIKDLIQNRTFNVNALWIGSDKLHLLEQSVWASGTKFSYVNWTPGEPDNHLIDENCVEIYTNDSKWNDARCTELNGYICEYSHWTEPCIKDHTSGSCYQIFDTGITWKNASDFCKREGGNLVTIESVEEQMFISDLMQKRTFNAGGLWLGSDKLYPEERRAWANGEKFSYVNWAPGEPSSYLIDENCIEIFTDDGTWNDAECTDQKGYICERSTNIKIRKLVMYRGEGNTLRIFARDIIERKYAVGMGGVILPIFVRDKDYIKDNNSGRFYKFVKKQLTWDDALNVCRNDDGTLLIIESPEEQSFIADQIRLRMLESKRLWLGSNKVHPESKRIWTDERKFTYINWAEGEPNNSPNVENCAEMNTYNSKWNNIECTLLRGYICEKTPEDKPHTLFIIITTVGSALVTFLGVMILCCLLHTRKKRKEKNEDYQDVQNMAMNEADYNYNRVSGTYYTINDD